MGEAHQINSGQPCMDRLEKRIEHEKGSLKLEKAKENKGGFYRSASPPVAKA